LATFPPIHDRGRSGVDISADQIKPFLGVELRGDPGRVHQVTEHHRDEPTFAGRFGGRY
jgi:hypothetical protein